VNTFDADKTIMIDNMLSRFHLIPGRVGQLDRQTDRRTDGQRDRIAISISLVSVLTRDKNIFPLFSLGAG